MMIDPAETYINDGPGCYHRPGRRINENPYRVCRNCGVAVDECPCSDYSRKPKPDCPACLGSGWVSIVRGRIAKSLEQWNNFDPQERYKS